MNPQETMEAWLDKISSPGHAKGYFFVINEVVHPIFVNEFFSELNTIEDAWNLFCDSWLNSLYGQKLNRLYPFILRGKVTENEVIVGNNCDFFQSQIEEVFNLPETSLTLDPELAVSTNLNETDFILLKFVYQHTPYLQHLPWKVQFTLRNKTLRDESNKVLGEIITKDQAILAGKRRLGNAPSVGTINAPKPKPLR